MSDRHLTALVCDDHGTRVTDWQQLVQARLGPEWEVISVSGEELSTMVEALSLMEVANRAGRPNESRLDPGQVDQIRLLDRADLVIFDSDLTPSLEDSDTHSVEFSRTLRNQMGDTVARQIRTYTKAGYITVVNMYWGNYPGERVFDLTLMLGQHSHADLHLSEDELSEPALWTGPSGEEGYHPWHWPILSKAHELVRRSEDAITDLGAPVLASLGIDPEALTPKQMDLFGEDIEMNFTMLTETSLGYRYLGSAHDQEALTRMAASVVRRWLSRIVLVGQNAISDAPHLLTRFSPVLGDKQGDLDTWNSVLWRDWDDVAVLSTANGGLMESLQPFIDRPVYSVDAVRELLNREPPEYLDPPDVNFAEDLSKFVSFDAGTDFETDAPGPYFRRFVAELPDVDYEPYPRLLK